MTAIWKLLVLASIGLAGIVVADSYGQMEAPQSSAAFNRTVADVRDCTSHHSTRCTVDIRYAYPAADLHVVPEDVYF